MSRINSLVKRLNTYPISEDAKETELNIIKTHYITTIMKTVSLTKTEHRHQPTTPNNKMGHFHISGKGTRIITKLFKDTQIKIAFRTQNTIQNVVKHHPRTDKCSISGIYQMKCLDCPLKYTGRTDKHSTSDTSI
jgi:hypothetical protein